MGRAVSAGPLWHYISAPFSNFPDRKRSEHSGPESLRSILWRSNGIREGTKRAVVLRQKEGSSDLEYELLDDIHDLSTWSLQMVHFEDDLGYGLFRNKRLD